MALVLGDAKVDGVGMIPSSESRSKNGGVVLCSLRKERRRWYERFSGSRSRVLMGVERRVVEEDMDQELKELNAHSARVRIKQVFKYYN